MGEEQAGRVVMGTISVGVGLFAGVPVVERLAAGVAGSRAYDLTMDALAPLRQRFFRPSGLLIPRPPRPSLSILGPFPDPLRVDSPHGRRP